jgi:hypothetical protein
MSRSVALSLVVAQFNDLPRSRHGLIVWYSGGLTSQGNCYISNILLLKVITKFEIDTHPNRVIKRLMFS